MAWNNTNSLTYLLNFNPSSRTSYMHLGIQEEHICVVYYANIIRMELPRPLSLWDSNPQPSPLRLRTGGGGRAAAIALQQGVRMLSAPASNGLPLQWAHLNYTLNLKFE